jgi:hypothetical protein
MITGVEGQGRGKAASATLARNRNTGTRQLQRIGGVVQPLQGLVAIVKSGGIRVLGGQPVIDHHHYAP